MKGSYADGIVLFFRGPLEPGVLELAAADATYSGDANANAGAGLTDAVDADGDGVGDVAIGAPGQDTGIGAVLLFLGPISGALDATTADVEYSGDIANDRMGYRTEWGGDVDGDGTVDLLASAPSADGSATTNAGVAYVFYGPHDASASARDAAATLEGSNSNGNFGAAIEAGVDVDGDGFADALVGASSDDSYTMAGGAMYLFYGPFAGPRLAVGADAIAYGEERDQMGSDVELLDYDGDGVLDLAAGAPNSDGVSDANGRVYLFAGSSFL